MLYREIGREFHLAQERRRGISAAGTLIRRYGAAAIVMAFDEKGQADTLQRRIEICKRAYELLVQRADFPAGDIIFDPSSSPSLPDWRNIGIMRSISSRRHAGSNKICPAPGSAAGSAMSLFLSRKQRRARSDACGVSISRHPRWSRHGHRERGTARCLRRDRAEIARTRRGCVACESPIPSLSPSALAAASPPLSGRTVSACGSISMSARIHQTAPSSTTGLTMTVPGPVTLTFRHA